MVTGAARQARPPRPAPDTAAACLRQAVAAIRAGGKGSLAERLREATATLHGVEGDRTTVDAFVAVPGVHIRAVRHDLAVLQGELGAAVGHEGWSLRRVQVVAADPGAPTPAAPPKRADIIDAIASAVAEWKSYEVVGVCDRLTMPAHPDPEADPHRSKAMYVRARLAPLEDPALLRIARAVLDDRDDETLQRLVDRYRPEGAAGPVKNLVFGSTSKPDLVLSDALSNDLALVNKDAAFIYDAGIPDEGLSWRSLVHATLPVEAGNDEREGARTLHRRLNACLASPPERRLFQLYARRYGRFGFDEPALVPQVWVHYDPRSRRDRRGEAVLTTQRMDFLLLPSGRRRIVLEVDGQTHFTDDHGRPSPQRYAQMMRDDRELRLRGYEVFRFGGAELQDQNASASLLDEFFDRLLHP